MKTFVDPIIDPVEVERYKAQDARSLFYKVLFAGVLVLVFVELVDISVKLLLPI